MARRLFHPLPLLAAAVLVLNDFVLKRARPGALTGKLSDLAGLFVLPIALAALVEIRLRSDRRRLMAWTTFACGIVFAVAKTIPAAVPWVVDPTDLVALAVLPFAFAHGVREDGGRIAGAIARSRLGRLGAVGLVAGATIATPAAQGVRRFPAWETQQPSHAVGGATVEVWVSRSTREGLGVSIEIVCAPQGLPVEVDASRTFVRLAGERLRPIEVVPARAGTGGKARGYLAFELDDRRAWNDGVRTATLRLGLKVGEGRRDLVIGLVHARPHPHGKAAQEVGP